MLITFVKGFPVVSHYMHLLMLGKYILMLHYSYVFSKLTIYSYIISYNNNIGLAIYSNIATRQNFDGRKVVANFINNFSKNFIPLATCYNYFRMDIIILQKNHQLIKFSYCNFCIMQ